MSQDERTIKTPADYAAWILLLTAEAGCGIASERWILTAPLLALTILHFFLCDRIRLRLGLIGYLLLALPFAFLSNSWEVEAESGIGFNTPYYISLYLFTFCLARTLSLAGRQRYPVMVMCGGAGMAVAALDIYSRPQYLALVTIFAVALLVVLRGSLQQSPPKKRGGLLVVGALVAAIISTLAVTAGTVYIIQENYYRMNRYFMTMLRMAPLQQAGGFSGTSKLGDIADLRNGGALDAIALRAFSATEPGYLRGKVSVHYENGEWGARSSGLEIVPDRGEDKKRKTGIYTFPGRNKPEEFEEPELSVYPGGEYGAHFFLPLQTAAVDTSCRQVILMPGDTLTSKYTPTSRGYGVYLQRGEVREFQPNSQEKIDPFDNEIYLQIPTDFPLRASFWLLREKIHGAQAARNKIAPEHAVAAIADWFANNYTYKIGISFAPDQDPLLQFITEKNHGHCELFASAGVLLLRQEGIPARYVTGFFCGERGLYGDQWLARKKHAHAWVEYYTEKHGWRTAEFTPPGGLPEHGQSSGLAAFQDYVAGLWIKAVGFIRREGIGGLLQYLSLLGTWLLETWTRRIMLLAGLGLFFYYRLRRHGRGGKDLFKPREFPDAIELRRKEFFLLCRELARHGLEKRGSETLLEYAARVGASELPEKNEAARFIRDFAALRYAEF
jgi:hypothetical protein